MDPVLQIFQQQTGGSAEGQGFGQFALAGAQLKREDQRYSLAERHLALQQKEEERAAAREKVLLPLDAELRRLQATHYGIEAVTALQKARAIEETNSELPHIYEFQTRIANSPQGVSDPEIRKQLLERSMQKPRAYAPGTPGGDLWTMIQSGPMFLKRMQDIAEAEKTLPAGQFIRGFNPKTGDVEIGLNDTEDRRLRRQNEIVRLQNEAVRLQQAGDRNGLANVRLRIQALEQGVELGGLPQPAFGQPAAAPTAPPTQEILIPSNPNAPTAPAPDALQPSTVTSPVTTTTNAPMTIQRVDRPLTAAQAGTMKETAAFALDTAKRIEDVKGMADTIFGPAAALGEIVVDKALANIAPELMNKERVRGREAAKYIKEGIYRSLNKGQGVLSNKDVERLNKLYPALEGLEQAFESPARAKVVLSSLQQQIAQDAYTKIRLNGLRPDAETIAFLPPKFIRQEFEAGRISEAEARAGINGSPYQDEITEEINRRKNGR